MLTEDIGRDEGEGGKWSRGVLDASRVPTSPSRDDASAKCVGQGGPLRRLSHAPAEVRRANSGPHGAPLGVG
eukprot:7080218-Pyramimonas_sp.AAC.1